MFKHRYFICLKWSAQFGVFLGFFLMQFEQTKKKQNLNIYYYHFIIIEIMILILFYFK